MGTTLENGVYLPSEGERNCYAGLKTNWEILDQKVADVTALQQAVAGALHREIVESLPTTDINPNTIYMILSGTSATENVYNEYMYVNNAWELIGTSATDLTNYYTKAEVDGKLLLKANDSDVVHKSGNETIGGVKTFTDNSMIKTSSPKVFLITTDQTGNTPPSSNTSNSLRFGGETVNNFGGVQCELLTTGENRLSIYVKDITTAKTNSIQQRADSTTATTVFNADLITPALDGVTALGSSSKHWSNIYATNYYYGSNNVEFSTKFVTTDTNQTISGSKTFSDTIVLQGTTTPTVKTISNIIQDSTSGNETISRVVRDKTDEHDVFSETVNKFSGRKVDYRLDVTAINNGTEYSGGVKIIVDPVNNTKSFASSGNNTVTLGYSGNRWRDVLTNKVNGVEPSSLGMPDSDPTHAIDISSYISDLSGGINTYIAPANGYITFSVTGTNIEILSDSGLLYKQKVGSGQTNKGYRPCYKNENLKIYVTASAVFEFKFIPCQGNV